MAKRILSIRRSFPVLGGETPLLNEEYGDISSAARELESLGVVSRDLRDGFLDFPALRMGSLVYLCWRVGEHGIRYWHAAGEGHEQRKPVTKEEFFSDLEIYKAIENDSPVFHEVIEEGEHLSIQVDMRGMEPGGLEARMVGRLLVVKWESVGWTYRKEIPLPLGYSYSIVEQRRNNGVVVIKVRRRRIKRAGA